MVVSLTPIGMRIALHDDDDVINKTIELSKTEEEKRKIIFLFSNQLCFPNRDTCLSIHTCPYTGCSRERERERDFVFGYIYIGKIVCV